MHLILMNDGQKAFCKAYHVVGLCRAVCSLTIHFMLLYFGHWEELNRVICTTRGFPIRFVLEWLCACRAFQTYYFSGQEMVREDNFPTSMRLAKSKLSLGQAFYGGNE